MATTAVTLRSTAHLANRQIRSSFQKNVESVSFGSSLFQPRASSSFFGERVACPPSTGVGNGARVRCHMRMRKGGASGRIIFTPFGPVFTPDSGRRGGSGRGDWEKRNQSQEGRVRGQSEMMQRARDRELLKELERRLRTEGATSEADIDELMQQLEKKLRPEQQHKENPETEQQQQEQKQGQQPEYSTMYDFLNAWLKEQDRTMREERDRLQNLWKKSTTTPQQPSQGSKPVEERDEVYSPEELQIAEEEEAAKRTTEEEDTKNGPSDGTVVYLKNLSNGAELYLIGTSHISKQSVAEVRDVIQRVQPDYVMVELDRKRYDSMVNRGTESPFDFVYQMVQTLANGNIGSMGKLMGLGLSGFYRLLATRGLQPGKEFRVAIEEGKKVGAKVVLGDQDVDITLKHFGEQMSMTDALQFFARPMPSDLAQKMSDAYNAGGSDPTQMFEQLRDRKIVRQFNELLEREAPAFTRVLLRERNEVMTKALRNLSGKVVAVVGLAHLDGIEQLWREANEQHLNES